MRTEMRELIIPAGHARLWRMRAGERVTIAQTEGRQIGACDPYRYRRDDGVENHRSCRMNFVEVLLEYAIPDWRVRDPVNAGRPTDLVVRLASGAAAVAGAR
jgi:uncharacterized protein YcgI (DUF1989 family)